jgi:putative ABC transport system permease protein
MDAVWQDLKFAVRRLYKFPGFTLVALLALALGIRATSAIFSVFNAALLRPLPYEDPDRLVIVWQKSLQKGTERSRVSGPNFLDWQAQNLAFEEMAVYSDWSFNLTEGDEPERLSGAIVSPSFFRLLGINSSQGRTFIPDDQNPDRNEGVVLSHQLWQRRFGSDLSVIGKEILINGRRQNVLGVLPPDFQFQPLKGAEIWSCINLDQSDRSGRDTHGFSVIARLKPGVSVRQAQDDMATISSKLEQQYPNENGGWGVYVAPLQDEILGSMRHGLPLLLAAVFFVLIIACANVANMLLAQAAGRAREIAIRQAWGASRRRIIQQLLVESLLLASIGGGLGMLLAVWGVRLLDAATPLGIPQMRQNSLDFRVLGFSAVMCLVGGVLCGLAPALEGSKTDLTRALKEGGSRAGGGFRRNRLRNLLAVSEITMALVLLTGAFLLIKSFNRLQQVDPGFNPENATIMHITLPMSKFREGPTRSSFFQELTDRIHALPGVENVGGTITLPLSGTAVEMSFIVQEHPVRPGEGNLSAEFATVTPDFFKAMGTPLLAGREFTQRDDNGTPLVAIINETFAKRFFRDDDPIGRHLVIRPEQGTIPREIVGITKDIKQHGLDAESRPAIFIPYSQMPIFPTMRLVMRTDSARANIAADVRSLTKSIEKDLPIYNISTLDQIVSDSLAKRRLSLVLVGIFSSVALLLSISGVYGVLSYNVVERTHEIGVRMAVGAQRTDILKLIVGRGASLGIVGVLLGSVMAVGLTRFLASQLYGVSSTDGTTFLTTALLLLLTVLVASYLPARRATKIDPVVAMHHE